MEQFVNNRLNLQDNIRYGISRSKGITIETNLAPYNEVLKAINQIDLKEFSEPELRQMAGDLKHRAREGEYSDRLLPEVYALVKEVATRSLGMTPYNVQVVAGIVLHRGKLTQMQTGEGKTLAILFPACLNALTGKGIHIMTANDYLAKRDALWMGPVYEFLGLSAAYVQEGTGAAIRKKAYNADITYLTAKEAGFDLLRDQLQYNIEKVVQRKHHMAIVDEADFILIDEARIPLVIAGLAPEPEIDANAIEKIILLLKRNIHFKTDKCFRRIYLTREGEVKVRELLGCGGIHEEGSVLNFAAVNVALHAHHLLTRDVDYIVRNNRIELVDEFTGRVADNRRWPFGIQNALEAKEGVALQREGRIYGSITIQHYINLYPRVAALTATAVPAANEFIKFYNLATVVIPPNMPVMRIDAPDLVFTSRRARTKAVVEEIKAVHAAGRPILVGTTSVKESQQLADTLAGIPCRVLNAKNNEQEAELIALAGKRGAVTISTNMAGRGTDIQLGGGDSEEYEAVKELGGLYVIGTNRHESVRVDNQLRGRAGRQGDPGLSRFFISLEDDLIKRYSITEFIPPEYPGVDNDEPVADRKVAKEIIRAQEIIEDQNYEIRRTLRGYSALVEKQRMHIQILREAGMCGGIIPEELWLLCEDHHAALSKEWDPGKLRDILLRIFLYQLDRFWADHLTTVDDIKEGIHLQNFGGHTPLLEFIRMSSEVFETGLRGMMEETAERFNRIKMRSGRPDFDEAALQGPSSTWTYLINDNPLPNYRVALFASRNIGFAVASVLPMLIFGGVMGILALIKKGVFRIFKKNG